MSWRRSRAQLCRRASIRRRDSASTILALKVASAAAVSPHRHARKLLIYIHRIGANFHAAGPAIYFGVRASARPAAARQLRFAAADQASQRFDPTEAVRATAPHEFSRMSQPDSPSFAQSGPTCVSFLRLARENRACSPRRLLEIVARFVANLLTPAFSTVASYRGVLPET